MKRFVSLLLALCLLFSSALAEEESQSFWGAVGGWFNNAANDVGDWTRQAWQDTTGWVSQAWSDVADWTKQAWSDSAQWVSQAWKDSTNWASTNWDSFILWVNTLSAGDPYAWIGDVILENGILAYDTYAEARTFLDTDPDLQALHLKYDEALTSLSLLNSDRDVLWNMIEAWSKANRLTPERTFQLAYPFLLRLIIEGESVIGADMAFSGPVVGQYMMTVLEALKLDSDDKAATTLRVLHRTLESMTRPTIIGDPLQNTLITDDHYYIENFTFGKGKYQLVMVVSPAREDSAYPMMGGQSIRQAVRRYLPDAEYDVYSEFRTDDGIDAAAVSFRAQLSDLPVTGKAVALWAPGYDCLFFTVTDQTWNDAEFDAWFSSVTLTEPGGVTFEGDLESDGAFQAVSEGQKAYVITRDFDDDSFKTPMTGHGWAAARGNNLSDNLKGAFRASHPTALADDRAENGEGHAESASDGLEIYIQTKFYANAARTVASCFDENGFKYIDPAEGKPMIIEVPADQYELALGYMMNRIANGEVQGVTDPAAAEDFVIKGSLTYNQAKNLAKHGKIESLAYDPARMRVTADRGLGLDAIASYAVNMWNGGSIELSVKESIYAGLASHGTDFIESVLSSPTVKNSIDRALIPAGKAITNALGPKVSAYIANAFGSASQPIYGAAAMKSAAKILRGSAVNAVTLIFTYGEDVADIIRGRISWKQLAKNVSVATVTLAGGAVGMAIGSAIPGAGNALGAIIGFAVGAASGVGAKYIADQITEDDANEMIRIIEEQFPLIAEEYFLNEDEARQSVDNLLDLVTAEMLKQMYQYKDHEAFARQLIELAIDPVAAQRPYIDLPDEDTYSDYLTEALEAIYEDMNGEGAAN